MELCHSYLFVTFVVMTVDQIVGRESPLMTQLKMALTTRPFSSLIGPHIDWFWFNINKKYS